MQIKLKDYILARDVINKQMSLADVRNKVMRFNKRYYEQWYRICYESLLKIKESSQQMRKTALQGLSIEQLRQLKQYQETIYENLKEIQESIHSIVGDIEAVECTKETGILWDKDRLRYQQTITEFSALTDDKLWSQGLYRFEYTINAYKQTIQSKQFVADINDPQQVQLIQAQQELINDLNVALQDYRKSPEGLILFTIIGGIL